MLLSVITSNPEINFRVYIISKDLDEDDLKKIAFRVNCNRISLILIPFDDSLLIGAPTSSRYPLEIYYRIFAAKVLPADCTRILYLDPDIVVINKLDELYNMDFEGNYFIGATHIRKFLRKFNEIRVKAKKQVPYINTGVMLMNIEKLRCEQNVQDVYQYINKYKLFFTLPDQDIIFGLYGDKIKLVDYLKYNLSDRTLFHHNLKEKNKIDFAWVRENTVIIHYCGRNKPWKTKYKGILNVFYKEYESILETQAV